MTEHTLTLPEPRFPDPRDAPVLRWGVLAPGGIAADFVAALHAHTNQVVHAVGSRDAARAERFAEQNGIPTSYGSYEDLAGDPDVDVVYIAAPHSEHARLALLSIEAGKHVLVEKPLATTAAEATTVVEAARAAGVFAMEAMWTRYLPQADVIKQLVDDGALGEVRVVTADFGSAAEFDPTSRMFDPRLGGGALLDLGVYPVSWASFLLGAPETVYATGELASTGVDAQVALVLTSANGAQALLSAGLKARTPWTSTISGSEARIDVESPFWCASGFRLFDRRGDLTAEWVDDYARNGRDGLSYEAAAVARFVTDGLTESPVHTLDETVSVLQTIDEARRMLGYLRVGSEAQ
jgi:predicted dehydrogenase